MNKFKIPTILGLAIIFLGIIAGIVLILKDQTFISQASPDKQPQNITISNVTDSSVTVSWQTQVPVTSFITFGQTDVGTTTALDDRDTKNPQPHSIHFVTLKNLLAKTTYKYKISSGKISSYTLQFTTATPLSAQTAFRPIIGSVLDGEKPMDEGIAFLSIADAALQSSLIKSSGNFLIPIAQIRKADYSDIFSLTGDTITKLTVVSPKGQSTILFKLGSLEKELPVIKLGENLDLINSPIASPSPSPSVPPAGQDLIKYDLNGDGKINAADNALILQNFGNPSTSSGLKNKKADLNSDGMVDKKDLDLMAAKIKELGSQ